MDSSDQQRRRPPIPDCLWQQHRDIVTDLYIGRGYILEDVVQYMIDQHDFHATKQQYKRQFAPKKWNLRKNVKRRQSPEVVEATAKDANFSQHVSRLTTIPSTSTVPSTVGFFPPFSAQDDTASSPHYNYGTRPKMPHRSSSNELMTQWCHSEQSLNPLTHSDFMPTTETRKPEVISAKVDQSGDFLLGARSDHMAEDILIQWALRMLEAGDYDLLEFVRANKHLNEPGFTVGLLTKPIAAIVNHPALDIQILSVAFYCLAKLKQKSASYCPNFCLHTSFCFVARICPLCCGCHFLQHSPDKKPLVLWSLSKSLSSLKEWHGTSTPSYHQASHPTILYLRKMYPACMRTASDIDECLGWSHNLSLSLESYMKWAQELEWALRAIS